MTAAEAAELIGCTIKHVQLLCRTGKIKAQVKTQPHTKHDGTKRFYYLIPKSEVLRYKANPNRRKRKKVK